MLQSPNFIYRPELSDAGERRPHPARRLRAGQPPVVLPGQRPARRRAAGRRRRRAAATADGVADAGAAPDRDRRRQGDGARLPPPVAGDGQLRQQADQGREVPDGDARPRAGAGAGDRALHRRGDVHAGQGLRVADDGAVHVRQQRRPRRCTASAASFGGEPARASTSTRRSARACSRSSASWRRARTATRARRSTAARSSSAACCARRSPIRRPTCPQLPPLMATQTTRQQVDMHTAPDECAELPPQLHQPGRLRLRELRRRRRLPHDGERRHHRRHRHAGRDGGERPRSPTASSESAALAASPEARRCYATTWMRYAFGRADAAGDELRGLGAGRATWTTTTTRSPT